MSQPERFILAGSSVERALSLGGLPAKSMKQAGIERCPTAGTAFRSWKFEIRKFLYLLQIWQSKS